MIAAVHGHPIHAPARKAAPFDAYDEYVGILDTAGIDRMVIWGSHSFGPLDETVFEFVRRFPDRFLGAPEIIPTQGKPIEKMKEFADKGMCGIKLLPGWGYYPNDQRLMYPIYELAAKLGFSVAIHSAVTATSRPGTKNICCQPVFLDEVAGDFPQLQFVIAHCGWPLIEQTLMLHGRGNISVETCPITGFTSVWGERLKLILETIGPKRMLFGYPCPIHWQKEGSGIDRDATLPPIQAILERTETVLEELGVAGEDRADVWGRNALRIFGKKTQTEETP